MTGTGATSPKTRTQRVVWWIIFSIFMAFVVYVLVHQYNWHRPRASLDYRLPTTRIAMNNLAALRSEPVTMNRATSNLD